MAEDFVQLAADGAGAKMRTRGRTIGANAVEEQYVLVASERVVVARLWWATSRIPCRAVTSQPLFTIWNGGTNLVAVRRLTAESDTIVAKAALSPVLRTFRMTTASTAGDTLVGFSQDTNDTGSAGVVARQDASADGTSSASALTATPNPTTKAWQQTAPRMHTAVGYLGPTVLNLLPDDSGVVAEGPLILRPSQGLVVRMEVAAAPTAADYHFYLKCVTDEYTLP